MYRKIISKSTLRAKSSEGTAGTVFGVTPEVHARAMSSIELSEKARKLYGYIASERMIGLVPDIGFDREGQETREVGLPSGKIIRLQPESYASFILFSILTKLTKGSLLYLGDPGLGKTSMAMMMGLASGREYNQLKKEVVHGQPQLTVSDLFGNLDLAQYQKGVISAIFHERITNKEADLIIDEINRIPTKTQSAILNVLSEKYVELFGEVRDVTDRAVYATMNDKNGGGTYELIDALKDRFDVAIMAFPRNYVATGIKTPDNTAVFPEDLKFKHSELSMVSEQIDKLTLSKDAEQRLKYFISMLNTAENASKMPEHGYKANIAGSGIKSSSLFNRNGHDDPKTYLGALIEGTVSDRFLRSVLRYAKALAWFRGKPQVDSEDIAAVIIPASMHRFKASPHFEKLDVLYKYDAWERSRQLWTMSMEKYATKYPNREETVSESKAVSLCFSDEDYGNVQKYESYDELREALEDFVESGAKLATIVKTMEHFASSNLEGSEGLEELLAMKLLFFEIYGQVLEVKTEIVLSSENESLVLPEKVKPKLETRSEGTLLANIDPVGMSYNALLGGVRITMGSIEDSYNPPHTVRLRPFQMAKHLVTQEMYEKVMGNNPSYFKPSNDEVKEKLIQGGITDTSQHPVEQVSYEEGYSYAQKLSGMDLSIPETIKSQFKTQSPQDYADFVMSNPGKGLYRVATDSEQEYATQGGANTKYFWGDDFTKVKEYGWTAVDNDAGEMTHPVGQKKPNNFGLYDVIGNVWTWTHDWYKDDFYSIGNYYGNPNGPDTGLNRGLRGGSWHTDCADRFCSTYRYFSDPDFRCNRIGLRLVRT